MSVVPPRRVGAVVEYEMQQAMSGGVTGRNRIDSPPSPKRVSVSRPLTGDGEIEKPLGAADGRRTKGLHIKESVGIKAKVTGAGLFKLGGGAGLLELGT
jgi:hypothetical protein